MGQSAIRHAGKWITRSGPITARRLKSMNKRHLSYLIVMGICLAATINIANAQARPARRQAPEGMVLGPWADAGIGTRITNRDIQPNPLKDIVIESTMEVVAADESSVTIKASGSVNGKSRGEQQKSVQRFISPSELEKTRSAWGRKEGQEKIAIGDKQVQCDIYRRTEKDPARDATVVQTTYVSEDVPSWIVRVVNQWESGGKSGKTVYHEILSFTWRN
jgi:hypothetical protein